MLFYLTSLFRYFPAKLKISVVCLLFLLILASFVETLSLGTIPVFVGLISNPEGVQDLLDQNNINIDITVISNEDLIVYGSLLLLVIFFFKNLYLFFLAFFNLKVTKAITVNLGVKLFSSYVRDSYSNHVQKNLSELTRNLTSEVTQTVSFITSFLKILRESFLFVFLILLLLAYNPMISVLVFSVIGGVSLAIILIIKGPLKRFSQKSLDQRGDWYKSIAEGLHSVKFSIVVQALGFLIDNIKRDLSGVEQQRFKAKILGEAPKLLLEVTAIGTIFLVTVLFAYLSIDLSQLITTLSLVGVILIRLIPAFNILTTMSAQMITQAPATKVILQGFAIKPHNKTGISRNIEINKFSESIEIKDLYFSYPNSSDQILENINLKILKGSKVGIVGKSGSGKSTLIDLILGLQSPSLGSIFFDSGKLSNADLNIGYIPQHIYLLDDSLESNIAFAETNNKLDLNHINPLIQSCILEDLVNAHGELEKNYIGDSGARISGGQRQRIGIARALYRKPEILIIDEGTNALDKKNEEEILKMLFSSDQDRTIILIAHHPAAISKCDQIIYLDEGRVKGIYTYKDFMDQFPNFFAEQ